MSKCTEKNAVKHCFQFKITVNTNCHNCIHKNLSKATTPKIDKTKILKTNGSLMKVESIAECSLGAFCNIFTCIKR